MASTAQTARASVAPVWSIQPAPEPSGATSTVLSGVSCSSRRACLAVGDYSDRAGRRVPLAERWTGTRWSIERTAVPSAAPASFLFDARAQRRHPVARSEAPQARPARRSPSASAGTVRSGRSSPSPPRRPDAASATWAACHAHRESTARRSAIPATAPVRAERHLSSAGTASGGRFSAPPGRLARPPAFSTRCHASHRTPAPPLDSSRPGQASRRRWTNGGTAVAGRFNRVPRPRPRSPSSSSAPPAQSRAHASPPATSPSTPAPR